jgi:3-deoxy-D-manno-octulosonic-acid transferase
VGEARSAITLGKILSTYYPERKILLSVGTPLGLEFARDTVKGLSNFQTMAQPIDVWGAPNRTFNLVAPSALIIIETELWPGLIQQAKKRQIPLILACGRLSPKSTARYQKIPWLIKPILQAFHLITAISPEDSERFLRLGANPTTLKVLGFPKHDELVTLALAADVPETSLTPPYLVIAGSTHPGEEEIILSALLKLFLTYTVSGLEYNKNPSPIKLILAPRHTNRAHQVLKLAQDMGFAAQMFNTPELPREQYPDVGVVSKIGILRNFYRQGDLAVVGGSLVAGTGHNPLEPAALARASIFGPNMGSFLSPARALMDKGAAKMVLPVNLHTVLAHFLADPQIAREAGLRGRELVASLGLAAPVVAEAIKEKLDQAGL